MLSPAGSFDFFMFSQLARVGGKKPTNLVIFVLVFVMIIFIELMITLPFLKTNQIAVNAVSTLTCIFYLALIVSSDPGYLKRDKIDFLHLLEVVACT